MNYDRARLKALRHIPIDQVVNREITRERSNPSIKATNVFISPKVEDFKATIEQIRQSQESSRQLQVKLREMLENAYYSSLEDVKNLKNLIETRTAEGKPVISFNKQLNKLIAHSAALYSALSPAYQAESLSSSTKIEEFLTEIVTRANAV